jgi:hypothetical protein
MTNILDIIIALITKRPLAKPVRLTLKEGVWYDKKGNAFCPSCYANEPPLYAALQIEQGKDEQGEEWIKRLCPKCGKHFNEGDIPIPKWAKRRNLRSW